ncbi:MAG: HEPN domain-containing protein [Chryseobacterium sp.]|nr:MAG: HEPN domain-containing protein [Chryseobacterium sp.]
METQFSQSGQFQKETFLAFIKELVQKFKPEQIYSIGKNIDLKVNNGCFIENHSTESYHYFLLMVTESVTRIEHEVQDFANNHYPFGKITILAHGQETIAEAIKANNRFFITIYNEGKILYSRDGMVRPFQTSSLIPTQGAVKAQKHYNHRFPLATGFLKSTKECLTNQHYNLSAFMAHQVVEQCCIALIRVHLAYRSDIHNLYRQLRLCESFSSAPSSLFLSGRDDDKRLLDIMVKSYSAARYKDDFKVEQADAEQIFTRVSTFLKLTEIMCGDKIKSLAAVAESYTQLKKESEVVYGG